jgi:hypothetical protein
MQSEQKGQSSFTSDINSGPQSGNAEQPSAPAKPALPATAFDEILEAWGEDPERWDGLE